MNNTAHKLLAKVLHDNGYSLTEARQKICHVLWNQEPQSMREVADALKGSVDRASLYRTVTLFEKLGLIHRVYIGWKYKIELSDVFLHHHHHISCLGCGKIQAIHEEEAIEQLIQSLGEKYDVTAERHQLEIQGYCVACRAART